MTTGIVISVASSLIVLFVTLFIKDYFAKKEIVSVQNLYREAREEVINLKKENDFLKEKLERTEDYVKELPSQINLFAL